MIAAELVSRLRDLCAQPLAQPGTGATAARHLRLCEIGREDLSLARLAEAHYDALAILAEAGRAAATGAIYGVWAAESPQATVTLSESKVGGLWMHGTKMFASGAGVVDRALVTVNAPEPLLIEIDLRSGLQHIHYDTSGWKAAAFALTNTASVTFDGLPVDTPNIIEGNGWYLKRTGFWHGACGPAACWAGGAAGLLDYAWKQSRSDPHTVAHKGGMQAAIWSMLAMLATAGRDIDADPLDQTGAQVRALSLRHSIEQGCTEVLERFGRAYGPYPLAFDQQISRRCQELTIYLRQCHAERDLESLGRVASDRYHIGLSERDTAH